MPVAGGVENPHGKVNILLQTYISRGYVDGFSLVSDSAYVAQVGIHFKTQFYAFQTS
jgi:activating signal cointegrator complex subunit 3